MNITVDRAVIEQALAVLENPMYGDFYEWTLALKDARDALRTALGQQYMTNAAGELEPVTVVQTGVGIWKLEQPEQEPVAWGYRDSRGKILRSVESRRGDYDVPLYTAPTQRKPLTEKEIETYRHMIDWTASWSYINFARAIEAAHGIKE